MGRIRDPTNNQARINARIPYTLYFGVEDFSKKNTLSKSEVVRRALTDYLEKVDK